MSASLMEAESGNLSSTDAAYLEMVELVEDVVPDHVYLPPAQILELIVTKLASRPAHKSAIASLTSFLRQRTTTVTMLNHIYWHVGRKDSVRWLRRLDALYYPVHKVLTMHSKTSLMAYREMNHKVEELAVNIIQVMGEKLPRKQHSRKLTVDQEMVIALAYAQLGPLQHYSHLLVPERASGHWSRVVTDDLSECLLDHGHDRKLIVDALTTRPLKRIVELDHLLHTKVPALLSGSL